GLTFVYALSGLAINHVGDWDPNFKQVVEHHTFAQPLPRDETAAAAALLATLEIDAPVRDAFWDTDTRLEVALDGRTLVADTARGQVTDVREEPRFLLRV